MGEHQASSSSSNHVPVVFHPKVIKEMGRQPPVLLFEKVLEGEDVSSAMCALSIQRSDDLLAALTPQERSKVHNESGITPGFLGIVATDPSGKEFLLYLEKWPLGETVLLARDWLPFVQANRLKTGDTVQGWGYRLDADFRLALNFLKKSRFDLMN